MEASAAPYVGRVGRLVRPRLGVWGQWLVTFEDTPGEKQRKRRQPSEGQHSSSSSSSSSEGSDAYDDYSTSALEHDEAEDDYLTDEEEEAVEEEDDVGQDGFGGAGPLDGGGGTRGSEQGGQAGKHQNPRGRGGDPGGGRVRQQSKTAPPALHAQVADAPRFVAPKEVLMGHPRVQDGPQQADEAGRARGGGGGRVEQGAERESGEGGRPGPYARAGWPTADGGMRASEGLGWARQQQQAAKQARADVLPRALGLPGPAAQRPWTAPGPSQAAAAREMKAAAARRAERHRLFWQREARRRLRRRAKRALRCEHKRSRHRCRDCSDWFNTGYLGVCNLEYADGMSDEELRAVLTEARVRRDNVLQARVALPKKKRKKDNQTGRKLWPRLPGLRITSIGERGVEWVAGQAYNVSYRAQGHCGQIDGGFLGFYLYRNDKLTATLGGRLYVRPHAPDELEFSLAPNVTLGRHWLYIVGLDSRGVPHVTHGRWTLACQSLGPVNILPPTKTLTAATASTGHHLQKALVQTRPAAPLPPHTGGGGGGDADGPGLHAGRGPAAGEALGPCHVAGSSSPRSGTGTAAGPRPGQSQERAEGVEYGHPGGASLEQSVEDREHQRGAGAMEPPPGATRQGPGDAGLASQMARLEAALRLEPSSVTALCNYGTLVHEAHGDGERAQDCYRRALSLDPAHLTSLFNLAGLLRDSGHSYDEAEELYGRVLVLAPNDVGALCNYASLLYEVRGMADLAERVYRQALLIDPSDAAVLSNYAQLLLSHRQDAQGADFMYAKAVEYRPDDADTLANYASFIHTVVHDYTRAEDMYKRALVADPTNAQALCNYASLLTVVRKDCTSALRLLSAAPYSGQEALVRCLEWVRQVQASQQGKQI